MSLSISVRPAFLVPSKWYSKAKLKRKGDKARLLCPIVLNRKRVGQVSIHADFTMFHLNTF
jgi:hypothetical protein